MKAELARDGNTVYLVRVAGLRDGDPSKMTPADVQSIGTQASREAVTAFLQHTFMSKDFMKERYGLAVESWNREAEKKAN